MSELIPSISFSEFRKLRPEQLRRLKSAEITFNCEYLFTFINPTTHFIRIQAEYHGQLSNSGGKETLEEIKEAVPA